MIQDRCRLMHGFKTNTSQLFIIHGAYPTGKLGKNTTEIQGFWTKIKTYLHRHRYCWKNGSNLRQMGEHFLKIEKSDKFSEEMENLSRIMGNWN